MIALAFTSERPRDPASARGWEAEKQVAFYLARAFEASTDVVLFHGLRFRTPGTTNGADYTQIDHLVLHRHGAVLVESKATGDGAGEFHVDELDQWTRRAGPRSTAMNMRSPISQARDQVESLRRMLQSASPPLLDKLAGLLQKGFVNFPVLPLIAIADSARLTGPGAKPLMEEVKKAGEVVEAVRLEIESHHKASGFIGMLRAKDAGDRGHRTMNDGEFGRVRDFLLAAQTSLLRRAAEPAVRPRERPPPPPDRPKQPVTKLSTPLPIQPMPAAAARSQRYEALACRHCTSIRVGVVYRRDYCLLCNECSKYTPIAKVCVQCTRPASVRKRSAEFLRACDQPGGCGAEIVFWSAAS